MQERRRWKQRRGEQGGNRAYMWLILNGDANGDSLFASVRERELISAAIFLKLYPGVNNEKPVTCEIR